MGACPGRLLNLYPTLLRFCWMALVFSNVCFQLRVAFAKAILAVGQTPGKDSRPLAGIASPFR